MAKGRKHGPAHHERLLGTSGYGPGHTAGADLPDLGEEDVWAADHAGGDGEGTGEEGLYGWRDFGGGGGGRNRDDDDRAGRSRRWAAANEDRPMGGLSLAFDDAAEPPPRVVHQCCNVDGPGRRERHGRYQVLSSAPVSVPDWPKILRVDSMESFHGHGAYDGEDDDGGEWVPPHEYLAREYAKSGRAVANSVFEGVGRTLKGRDMRRVRDAVWSKTGFFG